MPVNKSQGSLLLPFLLEIIGKYLAEERVFALPEDGTTFVVFASEDDLPVQKIQIGRASCRERV